MGHGGVLSGGACRRAWLVIGAPAAAQRLVQAHMVGAEVGAGAGHAVLRAELGALGFQHGLEVDQPAAVALARQQRGVGGGLGGAAAGARRRSRSPRSATSASSTSFRRRQHRGAGRPRAPAPARPAGRAPGRARRRRRTAAATRWPAAQLTTEAPLVSAPSVRALRPSEPLSLKLGQRAASACATRASGRADLLFGGAHVGALAQRLGRECQRQVAGGLRHRRGRRPAAPPARPAAGRSAPPAHGGSASRLVCSAGMLARASARPAARACSASSDVDQAGLHAPAAVICSVSCWLARLSCGDRQPRLQRRAASM